MEDVRMYGKKEVSVEGTGTGLYKLQFTTGGELPESLDGLFTTPALALAAAEYAEAVRADKAGEPTANTRAKSQAKKESTKAKGK